MTTPEHPACPFCGSTNINEFVHSRVIDGDWHDRPVTQCLDCLSEASTEIWRTKGRELVAKAEAFEYVLSNIRLADLMRMTQDKYCPPILKEMIEKEK